MKMQPSIVIIGAGNLATQLAIALQKNGIRLLQIFSRTEESAKTLATLVNCEYTTDINALISTADFYLYAVKDDALENLLTHTPSTGIHAHTAGSVSMDIFKENKNAYGVFYPLQTFSKTKAVEFDNIPIFVEANSEENLMQLKNLALELSANVTQCDSNQRQAIHLAAVFCCNFTNHMYHIASELLSDAKLPFNFMLPLIKETTDKLNILTPKQAQTGPAIRYDKGIINKHLIALETKPTEQELYELISKSIHKKQAKK